MPLTCLGCKKNLGDNRRAYAGHIQRCNEFKEFERRTLAVLGESANLLESQGSWHRNTLDMEVDAAEIEAHNEDALLQDEAFDSPSSATARLTIVIPPVRTKPVHFSNVINIGYRFVTVSLSYKSLLCLQSQISILLVDHDAPSIRASCLHATMMNYLQ
jgi:hypothetical protein